MVNIHEVHAGIIILMNDPITESGGCWITDFLAAFVSAAFPLLKSLLLGSPPPLQSFVLAVSPSFSVLQIQLCLEMFSQLFFFLPFRCRRCHPEVLIQHISYLIGRLLLLSDVAAQFWA